MGSAERSEGNLRVNELSLHSPSLLGITSFPIAIFVLVGTFNIYHRSHLIPNASYNYRGTPIHINYCRQLAIASFFPIVTSDQSLPYVTVLAPSSLHVCTTATNNTISASVILSVYRETPPSVYDKKDTQV
ncbi:hypothetical protein TWF225_008225 [Orbilia oligospora]|uniref:Uncharacterized protein n=1 Tax=Orbilia oligospora TaxID=2813651 RepID=A0A7C8TXL9_ORBOL|nr:hypothetical protein TWF751_000139 [Orbilia oligospora]KAF3194047.1 hypothetical protein TWF225_008225 [Orbilia oligospora]KAF3246485.1 hypothetical protein TWF128_008942 [Orbilia oligospora]KAF3292846.1 hypothetical protein TWF132_005211 [Orbilia oligospora]TGJ67708.1 hypothetical protein EYR41_006821 [Orbilia oligospora]